MSRSYRPHLEVGGESWRGRRSLSYCVGTRRWGSGVALYLVAGLICGLREAEGLGALVLLYVKRVSLLILPRLSLSLSLALMLEATGGGVGCFEHL